MKAIRDPQGVLTAGLAAIRTQYHLPTAFGPEVLAAADAAARRTPSAHADRTEQPFVTLDPASSTDLDQAFHLERGSGDDLLLHYAIADVDWFVDHGGPIDHEAWKRGTTQYLPDGKTSLYPASLSEAAVSLLPDGPRPAVVFHVVVDSGGAVRLDGVTRSIIRSRAKLAYDSVRADQLPADFDELSRRIEAADAARGATRIDPPEQEVNETDDGRFSLSFRPRLASESANAAMSLATNMAVADALWAAGTGLFRVMAEPELRAQRRLRHTARAWKLTWPDDMSLVDFERTLDGGDPLQAAFMMAIRRAGGGASYVPFDAQHRPWHAAMAATYAHATAPLRRLADRYVNAAALAVASGQPVPAEVTNAFARLPEVMERADAVGNNINRAVIDLAEAVMLQPDVGRVFEAVVTDVDDRGARIQLCERPVVARVEARRVQPGDDVQVRLVAADPAQRRVDFQRVG
jgi:exoribonuclease R